MKIDIWSDIVCPFCYIGTTQFQKALDGFAHKDSVEVVHHSYQLMPDAPTETNEKAHETLAKRKGMSIEQAKQMNAQVAASGEKEGLVMRMADTKIVNTFDAHRLIHYATEQGKQHEATQALFEAYFTDTKNVADKDTLLQVAKKIGLDEQKVHSILESDDYADEVKADIQQAASMGIRGVPFFVIDDTYGVSGAQGTENFASALQKAWHEKHPLQMVGADSTAGMCTDTTCA